MDFSLLSEGLFLNYPNVKGAAKNLKATAEFLVKQLNTIKIIIIKGELCKTEIVDTKIK